MTRGRAGEKDAKGVTFSRKQSRRNLLKKQGFPETTAQRKRIETVARAPTKASPHLREERKVAAGLVLFWLVELGALEGGLVDRGGMKYGLCIGWSRRGWGRRGWGDSLENVKR
ncbi:hypothetical protein DY000_02049515 [Brassica cretica]|uniref:Uncharacterized protein n=1 Tax=Brassica cretica TaxID=69181 RepID=A0ABQ7EPZ5_BRACR|nr:hypothetical protein DY000_02049515 [Brassica cretica]